MGCPAATDKSGMAPVTVLAEPDREALDRRSLIAAADAESHDLCAVLARRREALRLTKSQLAAQIGTSREMIRYWESGKGNPTLRRVVLWARALDCEVVLR